MEKLKFFPVFLQKIWKNMEKYGKIEVFSGFFTKNMEKLKFFYKNYKQKYNFF